MILNDWCGISKIYTKSVMGKKNADDVKRKTGKDNAKNTYTKYGKYTQKCIRIMEALKEKRDAQLPEKKGK